MEEDQKHYENLTALLKEKHKRELLAQGEDEKSANRKAEKKAIETPASCCPTPAPPR